MAVVKKGQSDNLTVTEYRPWLFQPIKNRTTTIQMNNWNKESLNLQIGDQIIWQDAEIKAEGGPAIVSPGMKGQVMSLHDSFHMDLAQGGTIPPKALVQFESGESLSVDQRMKWGRSVRDEATGERSVYLSADC